MANLPVTVDAGFPDVYLLATTDPVMGGPDGVDNLPHRQLAERTENLKSRADGLDALVALLRAQLDGLSLNSGAAVRTAVLLNWLYGDASPSFELFVPGFSWRDVAPIAVTQIVAGDDTVDLASTTGLVPGRTYVVYGADGLQLDTVEVSAVLTATRLRARLNLTHTLGAAAGAFLARTAAQVRDGSAVFQDGDAYYSRPIVELRAQASGQHVLRRSADGAGTLTVQYRVAGSSPWVTAPLVATVSNAEGTRDEFRTIGVGGTIELRVTYAAPAGAPAATEEVKFMAVLPPARVDAITTVARPKAVTPADQAANVGLTPTLTGSSFLALYGLSQAGAEFQVSRNPSMSDLVLNSSTDFLASWVGVTGQSAAFADLVATGPKAFTLVASGVSLKTTDGGLTFSAGTVTGDLRRVHADTTANLLCAVGASGAIRTSADGGATYTTRAAAASYAGVFSGVFVRGAFVVAVGDGGTIQRSINGGAIFNAALADGAYAGTFTDLAGDGTGKLVAVGSGGAIQTSPDDGQTWVQRTPPASYAGSYRAVAMDATGRVVAVGDTGALHLSTDYGATWTAKTAAGGYSGTFTGVALQGQLVVAVGTGAEIQTSKDAGATFLHRVAGSGASAAFRSVALDANGYGLGIGDSGLVQHTLKLDSATTTFTIPAGTDFLQTNTVYWWRVRYQASSGDFSPWSAPAAFATGTVVNYVAAPRNLAPGAGDSGVSLLPTLQTSPFTYVGTADTHAKSQFQVATSAAFTSPVYDSGETTDLTSHKVAAGGLLTAQTTYYWRARHKGAADGFGAWSEPTAFTAQARPDRPSLTAPLDGATGVSTSPTLTTSAFSMPGGGVHAASQYQVSARSSFDSLTYDSGDSASLTSLTLPAGTLAFGTTYYARVRHKESGGTYSAWSAVNGFSTARATLVTDVFAAVAYDGTSATRAVTNGVNLADYGGAIFNVCRTNPGDRALVTTGRGVGKILPLNRNDVGELVNGQSVTAFGQAGHTLGNDNDGSETGLFNLSGRKYAAYTFRNGPKFFKELTFNHANGQADQFDLASLGVVGAVLIRRKDAGGDALFWHRGVTPGSNMKVNTADLQSSVNAWISVSGTTATFAAGAPSGAYDLLGFAHNDAADGMIQCDSALVGGSAVPVALGWRPQMAIFFSIANAVTVNWLVNDTVRGWDAGNDPVFGLHTNNVENTGGVGYPTANGFTFSMGAAAPTSRIGWIAVRGTTN